MLCEDCRKQDATVHMKQVVNNQKIVLNLCSNCAKRRGFSNPLKNIPFPLADLLRKIHGSNLHRGKRQSSTAEGMDTLKEEARLKEELKAAITNEDFERAAQIRDLIKDIQAKMETSDVR